MEKKASLCGEQTRRAFMQSAGAAVVAGALTRQAGSKRALAAVNSSDELRVGLIGCGGRGTGAVRQAILADPKAKLVALGDAFMDRAEESLAKLKSSEIADRVVVDSEHMFDGFDAYQKVIDSVDVVVMAAPPGFRPRHLKAAIEAGKHIFCEKPVAVDAPGLRMVLEAVEMARQKQLALVSGLCYRYQFAKQETIKRLHEGAVGDIINMECYYNTGGLWHKGSNPKWSQMEYQMRNWIYFDWLSGDHINEQHIHSLDKLVWAMKNECPAKVMASGGRAVRTAPKYGNVYDHFNCTYEWENGVRAHTSCRQWESTSTRVEDNVFGTEGVVEIQQHRIVRRDGDVWEWTSDKKDDMYQNEHDALFKAIRTGEAINNGDYMCNSTLMAIMGRMSAYTGKALTREEVLNSTLDLFPEKLEWGDIEQRPVPVPGVTPFV